MSRTLLCCAAIGSAAIWWLSPTCETQGQDGVAPVAAIERALAQPIELRAENRPLVELLQDVAADRGITIVVDRVALEEAGIAADVAVTATLPAIGLEAALRLILRERDLAFAIRDDVLLVTSTEEAARLVESRVYPVGDLLTLQPASETTPFVDFDSLTIAVRSIRPDSWDEVGGPGSIRESHASLSLVVSQTRDAHGEVARLLADLRAAKAAGGLPAPEPDAPAAVGRIRAALEKRVGIACDAQQLDELLTDVARDAGIPHFFDRPAIEEGGAVLEATVTWKLEDIRLRSALNVVLGEHGLDWQIRDEVLVITSRQAADSYEVVRVYPVADLVTFVGVEGETSYDFESVIELITSMVEPQNWPEGTGPGSIHIYESGRALVLSQTPRVHEEIAQLLAEMRAARDGQAELVAAANAPPVDNAELVVRVYHVRAAGTGWANAQQGPPLPDAPTGWEQDLAAAIEALVEPHTWHSAGGEGTVRALPGALIVQQTRPMHRQVAHLISLLDSGRSWPSGAAELTPLPSDGEQSEPSDQRE